ncbi:protein of unknown function [Ruminococcaceae bacterium BL-6]|nr:protein of unknown function [Ruminococcaceae bacterium BL-6]
MKSFCIGLRQELKPRGINVCAVHPGWMNTDMNAGAKNTKHTGASNFLPEVNVKKLASKSLAAARKGRLEKIIRKYPEKSIRSIPLNLGKEEIRVYRGHL